LRSSRRGPDRDPHPAEGRLSVHGTPVSDTFATLAYRDGVTLEVIGALLTHRSPSSALIYTHPTAEDLRAALAGRGVLDKVRDLIAA
jgi:hypothetical protein